MFILAYSLYKRYNYISFVLLFWFFLLLDVLYIKNFNLFVDILLTFKRP